MEEKDFNEMLLEEDKNPKNIRNIILGAIGAVVVLVAVLLIWSFTKSPKDEDFAQAESAQSEQITEDSLSDISEANDDRFEQIIQDVRNANKDMMPPSEQTSESAEASAPSMPNIPSMPTEEKPLSLDEQLNAALNLKNEPSETGMIEEFSEMKLDDDMLMPTKPAPKKEVAKESTRKSTKAARKDSAPKGSVATKGSYLQVGVFSKKPNKALLKMLKKHSYRTLEITINDQVLTKYLVGPFKSRAEANNYKQANPELGHAVYFEVK